MAAAGAYRHLRPVFDDGAVTLLKPLTWQGDVSIAPAHGGRLTLRRLDVDATWPGVSTLEEAGPRAVAAYHRAYGPATPDHVQHRFGEGLSAGRRRLVRWVEELGDALVPVDVEGTTAHVVADDVEDLMAARPSTAVRFLPGHDVWVMGPGSKDVHVTPAACRAAVTRKAHLVVVGGVVRGTWTRRDDDLRVRWLDGAPPPQEDLAAGAGLLAASLERDLRLTVDG